nr:hypothetical protein [Tanacetum cinerariifolium]
MLYLWGKRPLHCECPKPKENKAFVDGDWSDNEDGDEPQKEATCLIAIDSQEICLKRYLLMNDWIVDSGCTKHMIENRRLFTLYKAYNGGHVVYGRNLKGKVITRGNISYVSVLITDVEHVSGLVYNLISVGQLCNNDCVVKFTKVDCTVSKNSKTLAKGQKRNGLIHAN